MLENQTQTKANTQGRSTKFKTMCGGQALIEGIMMRGPKKQAVVVRKPDGQLETQVKDLRFIKDRYPVLGLPFIRGIVNFADSMYNGVTALMYSAEFFPEDGESGAEEEDSKLEQWLEKHLGSEKATSVITTLAVLLGAGMSIGLFFLLPTLLGTFITLFTDSMLARNLAESLLKIIIFVGYLALCSRMKEMKRVFSYHGAEHKTIFCYEAGEELTVENVRKQGRFHPRCGTSFMFVLIIIATIVSSIVFSIIDITNPFLRMLAHLILLPLVVGISYEFNRYAGRSESVISRALRWPGLMIQHLTVFEPDDSMIEVAITAMKEVIPDDGSDEW